MTTGTETDRSKDPSVAAAHRSTSDGRLGSTSELYRCIQSPVNLARLEVFRVSAHKPQHSCMQCEVVIEPHDLAQPDRHILDCE